MLQNIRITNNNNLLKKLHILELKSKIDYEIIESWRIQKYEYVIYKNINNANNDNLNINKSNNFFHFFDMFDKLNNINKITTVLKYNYLFNKYNVNINLITILFQNVCEILYYNSIDLDLIIEYFINNSY